MTVTVSIDGGATVRLAYDPRRAKEHVPNWTRQSGLFVRAGASPEQEHPRPPSP
jgi:hypothetical protein